MSEDTMGVDLSKDDLLDYYIQNISVEGLVVRQVFTIKYLCSYFLITIIVFFTFKVCSVYMNSAMPTLGAISLGILFYLHSIRRSIKIVRGYNLPTATLHWKTAAFEKKQFDNLKLAIQPYDFDALHRHYSDYLTNIISQPSTLRYVKPALFLALFTPLWAAFLKRVFDLTQGNDVIWVFVLLFILCSVTWYYSMLLQMLTADFVDKKQKHAKNLLDFLNKIKMEKERSTLIRYPMIST